VNVSEFLGFLAPLAPPEYTEQWDRCGFELGDPAEEIRKIAVSLDPTSRIVQQAAETEANLLVTHHPLFFRPLERLVLGSQVSDTVRALFQSEMNLVSCHTNWDAAPGGINDALAEALELRDAHPLQPISQAAYLKLVVFTPLEAADQVRVALAESGAGHIGNYDSCSYSARGEGRFRALSGASPYLGQVGVLERADEERIEVLVPRHLLGRVLEAMRQAHPYEEIAYELYPIENAPPLAGMGRVGSLSERMAFQVFVEFAVDKLQSERPRIYENGGKIVQRIAVCGGAGGSLWKMAKKQGADCLVTADVPYHTALEAKLAGFPVLDLGHRETEEPGVVRLAEMLRQRLPGTDVEYLRAEGP